MDKRIINLWADIGSEDYWEDLLVQKNGVVVPFEDVYVPLTERWPQPGLIGKRYFDSPKRIVVVGQNPRAEVSSTPFIREKDDEMFDLIRKHSKMMSANSLSRLFKMTTDFMLMQGCWDPIKDIKQYIGLELDDIAYLNLIPLATHGNKINLKTLSEAYRRSTKLQLQLLKPDKVLLLGKGTKDQFENWDNGSLDYRHLARRYSAIIVDYNRFTEIKEWLNS